MARRKVTSGIGSQNPTMSESTYAEENDGPSEYDLAYHKYVTSSYLLGMHEKKLKEMREAGQEELSKIMTETLNEHKKLCTMKRQVGIALGLVEATKSAEEECAVLAPIVELCNKNVAIVDSMLRDVEKTLNQLPIESGVTYSPNDAEKLDLAVEELTGRLEDCVEGIELVQISWTKVASILQNVANEEMLLLKGRIEELVKQLNVAIMKMSSLQAAKVASGCLGI